jgi:hypothetical protein
LLIKYAICDGTKEHILEMKIQERNDLKGLDRMGARSATVSEVIPIPTTYIITGIGRMPKNL